jgi:hypothetical protein
MDDSVSNMFTANTPEDITERGEAIYLNELRSKLEPQHIGEYAVIDVDTKKYFLDTNLLIALKAAEDEFPKKLFYIVRVGSLQKLQKRLHHDWLRRK